MYVDVHHRYHMADPVLKAIEGLAARRSFRAGTLRWSSKCSRRRRKSFGRLISEVAIAAMAWSDISRAALRTCH